MFDFFRFLTSNAWEFIVDHDNTDYSKYKAKFLCSYEITCYAHITERKSQLKHSGSYGVAWIDAEHENEAPYNLTMLREMGNAILMAEDNLLLVGIPFCYDYSFHGRNAANKKRRNESLRRKYNLDEEEKQRE